MGGSSGLALAPLLAPLPATGRRRRLALGKGAKRHLLVRAGGSMVQHGVGGAHGDDGLVALAAAAEAMHNLAHNVGVGRVPRRAHKLGNVVRHQTQNGSHHQEQPKVDLREYAGGGARREGSVVHHAVDKEHAQEHGQAKELGQGHDPRPRAVVEPHVQVRGQDHAEGAHGANVVAAGAVKAVALGSGAKVVGVDDQKGDGGRLVQAVDNVHPEARHRVLELVDAPLVQLRHDHAHDGRQVLVKHAQGAGGQRRVQHVVEHDQRVVEEVGDRPLAEELEPEERHGEDDVLVEEVEHHRRDAQVRPAAVHEQELLQEPELRDRVVGRHDGLQPLLAADANADVGLLDHADVVGAVADGQAQRAQAVLDEPHDQRLLQRRHAAAQHGLAPHRQVQQQRRQVRLQRVLKRVPVDDQPQRRLALQQRRGVGDVARAHVVPHAAQPVPPLHAVRPAQRRRRRRRRRLLPAPHQAPPRPGVPGRNPSHCAAPAAAVRQVAVEVAELPQRPLQLLARSRRGLGLDDHELHVAVEQVAAVPDVDGRLRLVAREHPQLDAGQRQLRDRLGHAVLQLVLDGSPANQLQLALDAVAHALDLGVAVIQAGHGLVVANAPLRILGLVEEPVAQAQRAQPVVGKQLEVVERGLAQAVLVGADALQDDRVGALAQKHDAPVLAPHDDRHALPRAGELERGQQLVRLLVPQKAAYDAVAGAPQKRKPHVARRGHQRRLVGRLRLVLDNVRPRGVGRVADDVVAQRQNREELDDCVRLRAVGVQVVVDRSVQERRRLALPVRVRVLADLPQLRIHLTPQVRRPACLVIADNLAVHAASDRALPELHDVLRQRARLVAEDVLHLPQIVRQVPRIWRAATVQRRVVHVDVLVDKLLTTSIDTYSEIGTTVWYRISDVQNVKNPYSGADRPDDVWYFTINSAWNESDRP
ncbi:hypothetical protein GGH94_003066 [Coemansia aciculifera]|uniref:Uncharacterized protein n=1 Tax=Coemansia aciculifera TaxID=417176 RepID=A0A9W8IHS2_9FUNG|nr:hypothetical protein GGH94_003066 [Coemansia aciculifera]